MLKRRNIFCCAFFIRVNGLHLSMSIPAFFSASPGTKKIFSRVGILVAAFTCLTLLNDALRSSFQRSSFYLAESLLFNTSWLLFLPVTLLQYRLARWNPEKQSIGQGMIRAVLAPVVLHVLVYPLLVVLLSGLFYYHTYSFGQTLQYTITEDLYKLVAGYAAFAFFTRIPTAVPGKLPAETEPCQTLASLTLQQGRKYVTVAVEDIFYIRTSTPYISLHLEDKQYLHAQTLTSLHSQLDKTIFIKVHRSAVINIKKVASWKSRLNGDYDISLLNGEQLRLSRNYTADFRQAMEKNSSAQGINSSGQGISG